MGLKKWKVEIDQAGRGHVWCDGIEIPGVSKFSATGEVGKASTITITAFGDLDLELLGPTVQATSPTSSWHVCTYDQIDRQLVAGQVCPDCGHRPTVHGG